MELAFETKPLRKLCEDFSYSETKLGSVVARSLRDRVADLWAATSVLEMPHGTTVSPTHCIIALSGAVQMKLVANHVKNPIDPSGSVKWQEVSRVKVVEIG